MQIEELNKECQTMQEFLEITCTDDPDGLIGRLADLNVYLARSGKLLADLKFEKDKQVSSFIKANEERIAMLPASVSNKLINAETSECNYYVNWLDRINRSLVHVGDNMRTQLSFIKEELKLTKNGY